jgi:peptidoglycan/xylan/chitin deacetylase (PgdA/CDA1 family)
MSRTTSLGRAALSALHYSGADGLIAPLTRGAGVIFTLHHVRPAQSGAFEPNRVLNVTPDFLESVVGLVVRRGFDVLSLDQLHSRLTEGDLDRPFACFTFDDGYRDTYEHAYPIFRRHNLPFAIYVATDFADGRGDLWWLALERLVSAATAIEVRMDGAFRHIACGTPAEKQSAFQRIYGWLRRIPEKDARQTVAELCRVHDVDVASLCSDLVMGWDEIRELASDPLVTIGAHTRRHYALAGLSIAEAQLEIEESVQRIEAEIGRPCRHFSFPYGDEASAGPREFELLRELGMWTAVTTRKSLIHARHSAVLTGLPRVSLNGEFQRARYVKVMLTGAPFAFWNMARWLWPRAPGAAAAGY